MPGVLCVYVWIGVCICIIYWFMKIICLCVITKYNFAILLTCLRGFRVSYTCCCMYVYVIMIFVCISFMLRLCILFVVIARLQCVFICVCVRVVLCVCVRMTCAMCVRIIVCACVFAGVCLCKFWMLVVWLIILIIYSHIHLQHIWYIYNYIYSIHTVRFDRQCGNQQYIRTFIYFFWNL